MAEYKFTEEAEHDLEEITNYTLQQWDVVQTLAYLDGLEAGSQLLADNPGLGANRDMISEGLFSFPYESHILYYLRESHGITIVRVLHQRMDPVKHL